MRSLRNRVILRERAALPCKAGAPRTSRSAWDGTDGQRGAKAGVTSMLLMPGVTILNHTRTCCVSECLCACVCYVRVSFSHVSSAPPPQLHFPRMDCSPKAIVTSATKAKIRKHRKRSGQRGAGTESATEQVADSRFYTWGSSSSCLPTSWTASCWWPFQHSLSQTMWMDSPSDPLSEGSASPEPTPPSSQP